MCWQRLPYLLHTRAKPFYSNEHKPIVTAIPRLPAGIGMMAQIEADEQDMDAVLAALHLAAEDDAIKTRTHIPLPVDMFSSRLDNMVTVSEQGRR